jgi:ATP-binding protein involved in chromosome partitioning
MPITDEQARAALKAVEEPELHKNLVDAGMITRIALDGDRLTVGLELMTPACTYRDALREKVVLALKAAGATGVDVEITWKVLGRSGGPGQGHRLPGVRNVIAVASGKGGVGKSTVATNLALALGRWGAKVGLMDADIYGPSVPQMMGAPQKPFGASGDHRIAPGEHYGLKVLSVGYFVGAGEAVVWRGPMIHKLLQQFVEDADWGELDYLVVDLPPGTGDAQLSLAQLIPISGAVMVTTPQEVAIIDVVKGMAMFRKVEVPILGVVENMSYYVCPSCGHHDEIFARGGGRRLAEAEKVPFLCEIPLDSKVRYGGDSGKPVVIAAPESEHAKIFMDLAATAATRLAVMARSGPRRPAGLVSIS